MNLSFDVTKLFGLNSLGTAIGGVIVGPPAVPCFVAGTEIETTRGPVEVEKLAVGDSVITATGEVLAVRWIGVRHVKASEFRNKIQALPICIKTGALTTGVPHRDLYVSFDHALFIDGVLVPAFKLLNGSTIKQQHDRDEVTYYHLECEKHVILVANGAAAESLLDGGEKSFENRPASKPREDPISIAEVRAKLAAPWCSREAADQIRRKLAERARNHLGAASAIGVAAA